MDKVFVMNESNQNIEVEVVRYFLLNSNKYLVYSLGEKDELGNVILYVCKIANDVMTDFEWSEVKNAFTGIVKANRMGTPLMVEDLNYKAEKIQVKKDRVFKLPASALVELSANKKQFPEVVPNNYANLNNINNSVADTNNSIPSQDMFAGLGVDNNINNPVPSEDVFANLGVTNTVNNTVPNQDIFAGINVNDNIVNPISNQDISATPIANNNVNNLDLNNVPFTEFNNVTSYNELISPINEQSVVPSAEPVAPFVSNVADNNFNQSPVEDYRKLYEEEKVRNEQLSSEINVLKAQLNDYDVKLKSLKDIIG